MIPGHLGIFQLELLTDYSLTSQPAAVPVWQSRKKFRRALHEQRIFISHSER